ncbi:ComF family protein [Wenzhouxiangella sp. XN79A]|nr:ComF family protein [Wenzhouxiangella sp. XN79A]
MNARRVVDQALAAVWPPRCVLCGDHAGGDNLCDGCRDDLPWVTTGCRRCAEPLPRTVAECGGCLRATPPFDAAWASVIYGGAAASLVHRFKFSGDLAAGRALADALAARVRDADRPQLLVPVPLHWTRQWRRGFNQAELLAEDVCRAIDGPPVHPLLERRRRTPAQSALSAGRRRVNVRGAFACRPIPPGLSHVALVDDVMTTGATLAECTRALKRAGVARVDLWVAARA